MLSRNVERGKAKHQIPNPANIRYGRSKGSAIVQKIPTTSPIIKSDLIQLSNFPPLKTPPQLEERLGKTQKFSIMGNYSLSQKGEV